MRHRFHLAGPLTPGLVVTITTDEFHHARVVRLRQGEEIELFDGRGNAAAAVVSSLAPDAVVAEITGAIDARESPVAIHLAMAVIALEKFELVLQKATELGVRSITPLVTERVELRPERYRGKAERWQKILFEAVKQCGRATLPTLHAPLGLEEALRQQGVKILFEAGAPPAPLPGPLASLTLFIGPEGGWSDDELELARERACLFQPLGPRRLRAETAAIAGITLVGSLLGDLGRMQG